MVAGAGALGSWLGGALCLGGADVTLVARSTHRAVTAEHGLTVITADNRRSTHPRVVGTVDEAFADGANYDLGLITVKSYDAPGVAREIVAALSRYPSARCAALATFQNGVGSEALVAATTAGVIEGPVVAGTLTTAVGLREPGIVAGGAKGGVGIAARPAEAANMLADALAAGGLQVTRHEDAAAMKWSKLLLNMIGSATSAIVALPPAQLFRNRDVFDLEVAAWNEALAVMKGAGLRPTALPGYPVPTYAFALRWLPAPLRFPLLSARLAGSRGDRLPGVAADLVAGRARSEINALHGAVADTGEALGIPVALNRALHDLVIDLATGGQAREPFEGRPDALLKALAPLRSIR